MENEFDTIGQRIRFLRESLRYKRREFCGKHNISESTLKNWEKLQYNISNSALNIVISIFDKEGITVSSKWLIEAKGRPPLVNFRNLSEKKEKNDETIDLKKFNDESLMLEDQNYFLKKYKNSVSTIISSFEMSPMLYPGDYVGGIKRTGKNIEKTVGRDCIIRIKNKNGLIVKRISSRGVDGLYCLSVINNVNKFKDAVMVNVDIEFSAPIIWVRKKN